MANNPHLVAEIHMHPGEGISLGDDLQNTSSNSPTSPTTTVYSVTDSASTDVTSSVGSPSASVSGTIVYTGIINSLVDGTTYHVYVSYTLDGNTLVSYWIIHCNDFRPPTA